MHKEKLFLTRSRDRLVVTVIKPPGNGDNLMCLRAAVSSEARHRARWGQKNPQAVSLACHFQNDSTRAAEGGLVLADG